MQGSASVHVTKLAAAQRQLDAAIRMTLQDEDELGVHTLAAAAYRILRDLKQKRGRSELCDSLNRSLFYIARDLASGKLRDVPEEMDALSAVLRTLVDAIRRGEVRTKFDVHYFKPIREETAYWRAFNVPSNFLKHADLDADNSLVLDRLDNNDLLLRASAAYADLMGQLTPEMLAYTVFTYIDEWDPPGLSEGMISKLRGASPTHRRQLCLRLVRDSRIPKGAC
jgi:hypothetical protein